MAQFLEVKPGELCLPSGRQEGAVAKRYFDQVRRFGGKTDGMPLIQVTEGQDGELMINDGVTRAMRIHNLSPDSFVLVEIIDRRSHANFRWWGSLNYFSDSAEPHPNLPWNSAAAIRMALALFERAEPLSGWSFILVSRPTPRHTGCTSIDSTTFEKRGVPC